MGMGTLTHTEVNSWNPGVHTISLYKFVHMPLPLLYLYKGFQAINLLVINMHASQI